MNRIILSIFAVALCFAIGQALECYKCDLGIFGVCATTKETCTAGQLCYSGKGKAAAIIKIQMKGCLDTKDCNKTSSVNFPSGSNSTVYEITKTCCSTDLCNSAPGLAHMPTLTILLATITSAFMTKVLV